MKDDKLINHGYDTIDRRIKKDFQITKSIMNHSKTLFFDSNYVTSKHL